MTPTDTIITFLQSHPAISVNKIETDLKLPPTTIAQALKGKRLIPPKHVDKILAYLANYGMKK